MNGMFQLDRASYGGISGGPLFNSYGKVVGMMLMNTADSSMSAFAQPINDAKIDILANGEDVVLSSVGCDVLPKDFLRYSSREKFDDEDLVFLHRILPDVSEERRKKICMLSAGRAAIIMKINNPDLRGKIAVGDIILSVDGVQMKNGMAIDNYLLGKNPGTKAVVEVLDTNTEKVNKLEIVLTF